MSINFTVICEGSNKFRFGSFKRELMSWALDKGEFTKAEFYQALLELKEQHQVTSKMDDKTLQAAWWNEFFNKHNVFTPKV